MLGRSRRSACSPPATRTTCCASRTAPSCATSASALAAALLSRRAWSRSFPDNTLRPDAPITRTHAVDGPGPRRAGRRRRRRCVTADFRATPGGGADRRHARRRSETTYPLDPGARLFRALNGSRLATSELNLAAGDQIRFVAQDGRVTYLEAEQSLLGASADRTSKVYRWEVRMTPGRAGARRSRATATWARCAT